MTQHTPTPWESSDGIIGCYIVDSFFHIASVHENEEANADFIVRACNVHDKIVAEIEKAIELMAAAGVGYNETCLREALKLAKEA